MVGTLEKSEGSPEAMTGGKEYLQQGQKVRRSILLLQAVGEVCF